VTKVQFANGLIILRTVLLEEKKMRRISISVLVTAGLCFAIYHLPKDLIANLTLGTLAIAFSGWLLNKRKATKTA